MSDEILVVQNSIANIPEYKITIAIETLGYDYWFQKWLWGGSRLRGGVIVDWVVFTPLPTPLEYDGTYWHTGEASEEDKLQRIRVAEYYNVPEVIVITSLEVDSDTEQDEVLRVVREKLR
jgi:hypothetical protein